MKLKRPFYLIFLILIMFIPILLHSQFLNMPESVVWDEANNRWIVSNTNGDLVVIDPITRAQVGYFNRDLSEAYGLFIVGDVLYVGSHEQVVGFNLSDGTQVFSITVAGAWFNDVTADNNGNLYVSDQLAGPTGNIYKININSQTATKFVDGGLSYPNGLYFDEANNRLILCSFIANSPINAISLTDGSVTTLAKPMSITSVATTWDYMDGVTMDGYGNYYFSEWGMTGGSIYRVSNDFQEASLLYTGFIAPCDITYVGISGGLKLGSQSAYSETGVLAVPDMVANTVFFFDLTVTGIELSNTIPEQFGLHQNFPNPFNPNTTIFYDLSKESNVKIMVFDLLGREIVTLVDQIEPAGSKSINWDGRDYTGNLVNAGIYIYQIEADAFIQTKKMVLLK